MNRRLLHLAARLYPRSWRHRYGVEFRALLDQTPPGWRDILDVLTGGLQMHLLRAHPALTAAALGLVGACAAAAAASGTADRFVSRGTMIVRQDALPALAREAFDGRTLTGLIEKYNLYHGGRAQSPAEDFVHRMRGDIGVQVVSPSVVQVSFASSNGRTAQQVTQELITRLVQSNFEKRSGSVVQVIDPPDEPQASVSPQRVALAGAGGFGGGALIGTLIGILRRRHA